MAIGSSLSGVTFSGLSSGIDSNGIITRLIALESVPIQRMQAQQAQLIARQGIFQQFKGRLTSLATAAGALNSASAFNPVSAASSKADVATISGSASAAIGAYELAVSKLAQNHKISSAGQASASGALNLAGQMVINGKAVAVEASDSLAAIAQKINSAAAGASAAVIDGGAGQAFLVLTSSKTGASGKLQVADLTGGIASSLGLVSGAASIREAITNGATGYGFESRSTAAATMMGATGLGPASIQINGQSVSIDLSADSLDAIAAKINATPGIGATATVRAVEADGKTKFKLDIVGATGVPAFVDGGGVLAGLGILQQPFASELLQAQNAQYTLDGIALTSESNVLTSVVPGATITLLKANPTTPETTTLTLKRDDEEIKKKVREFKDAFNEIVDFVKQNSEFNKDTFASGPLFGDPLARQVESELADLVFGQISGLSGKYVDLTQIGFGFDEAGKLELDESKLGAAVAADPDAVGALFRARGTSSSNLLSYVSSTSKTKPSGGVPYEISITQAATKGALTSAVAQGSSSAAIETLTFGGSLFGGSTYQLVIPVGSTQADTIARINSDPKLKDLVVASAEAGKLVLTSKKFGTQGNFSVSSSLAAATDNSGIGTPGESAFVAGLNVAGTISGEAATGAGQFLTGDTGNAKTEGLQVLYTGVATGLVGTLSFTKGVGSRINDSVAGYTDSVNGQLTSTDKALQTQIDSIAEAITDMQERLKLKEQDLRRRFAAMENAISRMQSQGAQLGALAVKQS